jgi:hypothetical protein
LDPDVAAPDVAGLSRLAESGGFALIDGEHVPIAIPREEPDDAVEFDRRVCACGLRRYLRPMMAADQSQALRVTGGDPGGPTQFKGTHILVTELRPGVRHRVGVAYTPNHATN